MNVKIMFGLVAVVLTFIGYIPYISTILQGKTRPHIYSWIVWISDGIIIFALQITHGAGAGAYMTLSAVLLALTVLILTLIKKVKSDITVTDSIFLALAFIALWVWLIAKQPLISALLIMTVDLLGFLPTVRKSWLRPQTEEPSFYALNTLRFAVTLAALEQYSVITMIYPGVWLFINGLFTCMLLVRRKLIASS